MVGLNVDFRQPLKKGLTRPESGPWFMRSIDERHRPARERSRARRSVCPACGREFRPKRSDQTYCRGACRQRAYRRRHGLATYPYLARMLREIAEEAAEVKHSNTSEPAIL